MSKTRDVRSVVAALLGEVPDRPLKSQPESPLDAALRRHAVRSEIAFDAVERQLEKAMSSQRTFGKAR